MAGSRSRSFTRHCQRGAISICVHVCGNAVYRLGEQQGQKNWTSIVFLRREIRIETPIVPHVSPIVWFKLHSYHVNRWSWPTYYTGNLSKIGFTHLLSHKFVCNMRFSLPVTLIPVLPLVVQVLLRQHYYSQENYTDIIRSCSDFWFPTSYLFHIVQKSNTKAMTHTPKTLKSPITHLLCDVSAKGRWTSSKLESNIYGDHWPEYTFISVMPWVHRWASWFHCTKNCNASRFFPNIIEAHTRARCSVWLYHVPL